MLEPRRGRKRRMILTKSQVPFSLFCLSLEVTLILVGLRLHPETQLSLPFIPKPINGGQVLDLVDKSWIKQKGGGQVLDLVDKFWIKQKGGGQVLDLSSS